MKYVLQPHGERGERFYLANKFKAGGVLFTQDVRCAIVYKKRESAQKAADLHNQLRQDFRDDDRAKAFGPVQVVEV